MVVSGVFDLLSLTGRPWNQLYLSPTFSSCSKTWLEASPVHIQSLQRKSFSPFCIPPFLVCYSSNDLKGLDEQAKYFVLLLKKKNIETSLHMVPNTTHLSIIALFYCSDLRDICFNFIDRHSKGDQEKSIGVVKPKEI